MWFRSAVAVGLVVVVMGCGGGDASRSGRLLTMAAEEAGFIDSLQDRLTRQLNVADMQNQMGEKGEAVKTLKLAMTTLKAEDSEKKMDDFRRIAGWTSVAQLSHRAGDDGLGWKAYVEAVEVLNSVKPESKRAAYVLSLSQVAFELKGKEEAGRLLVSGGTWAVKIDDVATRRFALTTFAQQLVTYDNLDDARIVMRNELDAAWRADTLAAMARNIMVAEARRKESTDARFNSFAGARSPAASSLEERESASFNIDVQYEGNYKQRDLQQGIMPR